MTQRQAIKKHFRAQSFTSFEANCNMQIALFPKQNKKKIAR